MHQYPSVLRGLMDYTSYCIGYMYNISISITKLNCSSACFLMSVDLLVSAVAVRVRDGRPDRRLRKGGRSHRRQGVRQRVRRLHRARRLHRQHRQVQQVHRQLDNVQRRHLPHRNEHDARRRHYGRTLVWIRSRLLNLDGLPVYGYNE